MDVMIGGSIICWIMRCMPISTSRFSKLLYTLHNRTEVTDSIVEYLCGCSAFLEIGCVKILSAAKNFALSDTLPSDH